MSKDKIEVSMNVYDIPILVETLEKANKEIEIIEEDKKIEPLKLNNSDVWAGKTNEDLILDKINEIIDYINKENK